MSSTTPSAVAADVFAETSRDLGFTGSASDVFPQTVRDQYDEVRQAVHDKVAAGRQLDADLAELRAKADLIPVAGRQRLEQEAVAQAQVVTQEADARASRALDALRVELRTASLPKIDARREALARGEIDMLFSGVSGHDARARAIEIAQNGSRDAASVLFSSYGRGILQTHGVDGEALEQTIAHAQMLVANGRSHRNDAPLEELVASKAYSGLDKLAAGAANVGSYGITRR